jgi:uncharacterized membrane protein
MLDALGHAVDARVGGVAKGLHRLLRLVFRMGPEPPWWLRVVAGALIIAVVLMVASVLFVVFSIAIYATAIAAVVAMVVAFLGLG